MNIKQIVMGMLKNNSNPIFANLIEMAEKGDSKGVENFARNYFKEQGKDFDKEINAFQSMFMNMKKQLTTYYLLVILDIITNMALFQVCMANSLKQENMNQKDIMKKNYYIQ